MSHGLILTEREGVFICAGCGTKRVYHLSQMKHARHPYKCRRCTNKTKNPGTPFPKKPIQEEFPKQDERKRCRATPPKERSGRTVTTYLSADDYRHLYDVTMARGASMAETLRQIIREAK